MIGLGELRHDAFHCGVQNLIGIDACAGQRIVLLLRHGKDESMRNHRTFRSRRKSREMLPPAISDPQLTLCIAKLGRSRFPSVGIDADVIVQKSADVNLPERFLRGVVGKMFELLPNLLVHLLAFTQRNFPAGSLVKIFQIEAVACGGLAGKNLSVLHRRD